MITNKTKIRNKKRENVSMQNIIYSNCSVRSKPFHATFLLADVLFVFSFITLLPLFIPRGGLMVSALVSGVRGPGSSPGRGHCTMLPDKTIVIMPLSAQARL